MSNGDEPRPPPTRRNTDIDPIGAAANDHEIARNVWLSASDREDDQVRDALGRMLGWVEKLVLWL